MKNFLFKDLRWHEATFIIRHCKMISWKSLTFVGIYYALTIFNTLFDGFSLVLLVNLLTGTASFENPNFIMKATLAVFSFLKINPQLSNLLIGLVFLFLFRLVLHFAVATMDGILPAKVRRQVQSSGFANLIHGDWESLRDMRVGQRVGALTEETGVVTKYICSAVRVVYFLINSCILMGLALAISFDLTLIMIVACAPIFLLLKSLFILQSRLSIKHTAARQGFAADITERLNGLFQIKIEGNNSHHIGKGLKWQNQYTRLDIMIGYCQAALGALDIILPAVALLVFYIWSLWNHRPLTEGLSLLSGVGIVGARAAQQVNSLFTCWSNLSRLSGSLTPVYQLFTIPPERTRPLLRERLKQVECCHASYFYNETSGIRNVDLKVQKGNPLVIRGPSGSGKTTIANLLTGIYTPSQGKVIYYGVSGKEYDAKQYKVRAGYVAQDIHLFFGTVRETLTSSQIQASDEKIWDCLKRVGAKDFVETMGGLDAKIEEAGRSLSGGEKRRLGIARVLIHDPDLLILDEIMSGLDLERKKEISQMISELSKTLLVIAITHDPNEYGSWNQFDLLTKTIHEEDYVAPNSSVA